MDSPYLRAIGFWNGPYTPDGWPDIEDFIDPEWDEDERDFVLAYLNHGVLARVYMGYEMRPGGGLRPGTGNRPPVLARPQSPGNQPRRSRQDRMHRPSGPQQRESIVVVAAWVYCVVAMVLLLIAIARETDTVPASGPRIALMLIPAAVAMMLGLRATGMSPSPFAAGTFALAWTILSGLHPGRVWRAKGSDGRRRAFGALWTAIAAWLTVVVLATV